MTIAEYKQTGTRTEQRTIHHEAEYDEQGNITAEAWEETVKAEVPVMGMVYRDMTPEEIAEQEMQRDEMPEDSTEARLLNVERRTESLETATDDMILLMAELIGG